MRSLFRILLDEHCKFFVLLVFLVAALALALLLGTQFGLRSYEVATGEERTGLSAVQKPTLWDFMVRLYAGSAWLPATTIVACGFVGPFDAAMRSGSSPELEADIDALVGSAVARGLYVGRVCGSGAASEPEAVEESMVRAIDAGCRLICVHFLTSDLPLVGALNAAAPFWRAARRCGF